MKQSSTANFGRTVLTFFLALAFLSLIAFLTYYFVTGKMPDTDLIKKISSSL